MPNKQELREQIAVLLESLIGKTWVELLEDAPEVMFAQHDIDIHTDQILALASTHYEKRIAELVKQASELSLGPNGNNSYVNSSANSKIEAKKSMDLKTIKLIPLFKPSKQGRCRR